MLYLKSCPRCQGDLYSDRDAHGAFRQCLQCGFVQDLIEAPSMTQRQPVPVAIKQAAARAPRPLREKAVA